MKGKVSDFKDEQPAKAERPINVTLFGMTTEFKDAKLVRLDDWYIPELKEKIKPTSDYRLITNVKTDKDGDTIVVLYVSHQGTGDKVQYFIKPEKCQLTSDHKDLAPAKIISKIEVTLKDRTLTHNYDD